MYVVGNGHASAASSSEREVTSCCLLCLESLSWLQYLQDAAGSRRGRLRSSRHYGATHKRWSLAPSSRAALRLARRGQLREPTRRVAVHQSLSSEQKTLSPRAVGSSNTSALFPSIHPFEDTIASALFPSSILSSIHPSISPSLPLLQSLPPPRCGGE